MEVKAGRRRHSEEEARDVRTCRRRIAFRIAVDKRARRRLVRIAVRRRAYSLQHRTADDRLPSARRFAMAPGCSSMARLVADCMWDKMSIGGRLAVESAVVRVELVEHVRYRMVCMSVDRKARIVAMTVELWRAMMNMIAGIGSHSSYDMAELCKIADMLVGNLVDIVAARRSAANNMTK